MKKYTVRKPELLGYLRRIDCVNHHNYFVKEKDALVRVFHVPYIGYVSVVTSPVIPEKYRAFFNETLEEVVRATTEEMKMQFWPNDGKLFPLSWNSLLEHRNVSAEILAESGEIAEYNRAKKERELEVSRAIAKGSPESDVLPIRFFINNYHPMISVTKVTLTKCEPEKTIGDFRKLPESAIGVLDKLQFA